MKVIDAPGVLRETTPRIDYLFMAIPSQLYPRLEKLVEEPAVWWIGQIEKYLIRNNNYTENIIEETIEELNFRNPIVGVHVRHTDKAGESAFFSIEDYMPHVKEYFDILEMSLNVDKRRVYLCTDDPIVIDDAIRKYPDYEFIVNKQTSKDANVLEVRWSSALGIMKDFQMLTKCDYVVCTLGSNICRRVYEIKMTQSDAKNKIKSIDTRHFEYCENSRRYKALLKHDPRFLNEIPMEVGDILEIIDRNDMGDVQGITKVKNLRTKEKGFVPSFKIEHISILVDFPMFN